MGGDVGDNNASFSWMQMKCRFSVLLLLFLSVGASTFSRNNTQDWLRPMLSSLKIVSVLCLHTRVAECAWNGGCVSCWGTSHLRTYVWWSLRTLSWVARQVRVTVGGSGFCWFRFLLFRVFVAVFMSRVWSTCSVCLSACQKVDLIWVHMHPAGTTLATHTEIPVWQNTCDEDTKVS